MTRFSSDFSRATVSSLSRKGIEIVGKTYLPGSGDLPYSTGETGYILNDNGTQRVRRFQEVIEAAA